MTYTLAEKGKDKTRQDKQKGIGEEKIKKDLSRRERERVRDRKCRSCLVDGNMSERKIKVCNDRADGRW